VVRATKSFCSACLKGLPGEIGKVCKVERRGKGRGVGGASRIVGELVWVKADRAGVSDANANSSSSQRSRYCKVEANAKGAFGRMFGKATGRLTLDIVFCLDEAR
jgi:hypothetical protein